MKKAIVIIPTYNEKDNIEITVSAIFDVFAKINSWEMNILVVDDSSPDKTYDLVRKLQKKKKYSSKLHLLINKQKAGLGAAYLKGMEKAFGDLKADVVFEFDADLSHDETKIPLFLDRIDQGDDLVLGSRYIPGGGIPDDWGFHRKVLSQVGNIVTRIILTDFSIRDWTGGYRAITKKAYELVSPEMNSEKFAGYTFQIGFLHKSRLKGLKISEVPYKFRDRTFGKSKIGPEYIKNALSYIIKMKIKSILNHRIFKFLIVGGLGTLVQLITLQLFRALLPDFSWLFLTSFTLTTFLSIEIAILSNFALNNLWTFADRKITLAQAPFKFLQFNITSAGSILIQLIVATVGEKVWGIFDLFMIPVINMNFDTGTLYVMIGILLGLFWNFFAYNAFIWKKKK
ncbi:MAG: glycosyltransferase [Candidatus Pacebacteria bacterium]|jgi:dolichol-phosphate mannosyltransferase|nr:glycosyltransferase [Candidatus Paceibacterota bacterium]MBT3512212.1 glycosyltransferase [Candidatus Paceibacterota bacterium]MBT4004558.1 glycosyltransferase [Candidatus Paceibacterota bacterium]MBT4359194.1 glycosyltransferase [Candidatus Paceibacterota bacterium]MBT4681080.1 glycosyltransferase [Candidatus Paceibacterota bacterium]